jgi:uncharacterized membrane protein YphA (DoxX/SURF4 family)
VSRRRGSPRGGPGEPPVGPKRRAAKTARSSPPPPPADPIDRAWAWLFGPQPIERLELLRILVPLAILGFMAARIAHADHWLSTTGFTVPDLGQEDYRQPLYLPPVPPWLAWAVGAAMVVSGLMLAAGCFTRWAAAVFFALLLYVALADRLAAFTVSKLGPLLVLALFFSPCGARFSVDAWRAHRREPGRPLPTRVDGGSVRFFQVFLPVFYMSSGICKARGDWLDRGDVLWTHIHDSYQTWVSYALGNALPAWSWPVFQGTVLVFECLAPVLFAVRYTRLPTLGFYVMMHAMIGLMFGPVIFFSWLMISLLVACYLPAPWLRAAMRRLPG